MTGPGTNTIVLGGGNEGAIVIDPAVDAAAYLDTLVAEGEKRGGIRRIFITHGHPDHVGGAVALRERLHAHVPIYAYNRQGMPAADVEVADGETFPAGEDTLRAIHTPGHRFDHLSYLPGAAAHPFRGRYDFGYHHQRHRVTRRIMCAGCT